MVHDQGLCGRKPQASPTQAAIETIRLYDTEAENEAAEWQHGEGQMDGEYLIVLQNVELQNAELQNVENKKRRITKRRK